MWLMALSEYNVSPAKMLNKKEETIKLHLLNCTQTCKTDMFLVSFCL